MTQTTVPPTGGAPGASADGGSVNSADAAARALARYRAPKRRRWPLATVAFLAGVGVTAAGAAVLDGTGDDTATAKDLTLGTVQVEQRDLGTYIEYSGTLSATETISLSAETSGTITEAVGVGTALVSGTVLSRIDGQPVTVVEGATPAYRDLASGVDDGADIGQLEAFLVAGGYDPNGKITVDQTWSSATTTAVKLWQDATGQEDSGTVAAARIAFVPSGAVVSVAPKVGETARQGSTLASVELPTTPTVTLAVSVDSLERFTVGESVDVVLADESTVSATVASVGSIATAGNGPDAEATVQVTITLPEAPPAGGRYIEGPATIRLPDQVASGVLAVPTRALVALAEGGQALEVVDGGGATHLVGIETGTYADGYVEVRGQGLAAGTDVVVPQ